MPDSRAEAKGLGSAKRDERPVRGRRHLVVISQVMRQSRRERESAGGLEQTASYVAFLPHPRECASLSAGGASGSELIASGRASSGFAGRACVAANERGR